MLDVTRSQFDSPNVVALTLLVSVLHGMSFDGCLSIKTFIHDEQQQFSRYLNAAFEVSKIFGDINSTSIFSQILDLKKMTTFDCDFKSVNSNKSFGLQVLDIALWLMKRHVENPHLVQGKSRELIECISQSGFISHFTQESMVAEIERSLEVLNSYPVTREQEKLAYGIVQQIENQRLNRMKLSIL